MRFNREEGSKIYDCHASGWREKSDCKIVDEWGTKRQGLPLSAEVLICQSDVLSRQKPHSKW